MGCVCGVWELRWGAVAQEMGDLGSGCCYGCRGGDVWNSLDVMYGVDWIGNDYSLGMCSKWGK